MALNTATSIVDYLKSTGQPSDFTSRTNLYNQLGLTSAFGDYRGTAQQNVTLLNKLSSQSQPAQPAQPAAPIQPETTATPAITTREVINETTPSPTQNIYDLLFAQEQKAAKKETEGLSAALGTTLTRAGDELKRGVTSLQTTASQAISDIGQAGTEKQAQIGESAAGFGGATSGATQLEQRKVGQDVAKRQANVRTRLGDQLYSQFSSFEQNYGTRFLESLSIPAAQEFLKLPGEVRGVVVSAYEDAIQKAEEKAQKTALSTLESIGYAVVGGKLIPTLEREKFELSTVTGGDQAKSEFERAFLRQFGRLPNLSELTQWETLQATQFGTEGQGRLTPQQLFDRELKLSNNFQKISEDATDAARALRQMEAGLAQAYQGNLNAGSQAVLVTFQKILDPTSVVRESEYARSGAGLSLMGRIEGAITKLREGGAGVTVEDLEDFVILGRAFLNGYKSYIIDQAQLIVNQANSIGASLDRILPPSAISLLNEANESTTPESELESDIVLIGQSLGTREDLIAQLVSSYPEFDPSFIADRVYTLIPDRP